MKRTKLEDKKDWTDPNFKLGINTSARECYKGYVYRKKFHYYRILDKFIVPINKCYHCGSKNTFHKRQQKNKIKENVWRIEKTGNKIIISVKYDLCLDCGKEFLIEYYVLEKINILKNLFNTHRR